MVQCESDSVNQQKKKMFHLLIILSLIWQSLVSLTHGAPPTPLTDHTTRTFRNALNQQGLQSILQSIEDRLRNLDQIYAIRYPRSDPAKDQYARRFDLLESKLTRIESLLEVQTEKISENMSSKNFKDDVTKDQIFRKIDSIYERLNHKLSYIEGKADMDTLKLQTKIDGTISKIERLDHFIGVRQADLEAELADGVEMIENIRSSVNSIENKVVNITKHTIIKFQEQITPKFEHAIAKLEQRLNHSYNQCQKDSPNIANPLVNKITEYENKIDNYENKMTNMYNGLWKKSISIENTIEQSIQITNLTRKEIHGKINNILLHIGDKHLPNENQNDGNLEIILDSFTNTIQRKLLDLNRKMEDNFQNVMLAQNLFLESCHRIQLDEAQLENKIGLVLEKLLDSFTNKTASTFKEIQTMKDMLKSHDTNVYRSLNQNTNNLIKLSEKGSEDRKKLEKILATMKTDIGNSIATVSDMVDAENEGSNQKLEFVTNILQELQDQVNDLDGRITEDNATYNSKQILQDILLEMELLNNTKHNLLQNKTSAKTIAGIIVEIYQILSNISNKLHSFDQYNCLGNNSTIENMNESIEVVLFPELKSNFSSTIKTNTPLVMNRFNYTLIKNETITNGGNINITTERNMLDKTNKTHTGLAGAINRLLYGTQVFNATLQHIDDNPVNITQSQDSFEYTDFKNNANEDGFIEEVSDIPEIEEYDEYGVPDIFKFNP